MVLRRGGGGSLVPRVGRGNMSKHIGIDLILSNYANAIVVTAGSRRYVGSKLVELSRVTANSMLRVCFGGCCWDGSEYRQVC